MFIDKKKKRVSSLELHTYRWCLTWFYESFCCLNDLYIDAMVMSRRRGDINVQCRKIQLTKHQHDLHEIVKMSHWRFAKLMNELIEKQVQVIKKEKELHGADRLFSHCVHYVISTPPFATWIYDTILVSILLATRPSLFSKSPLVGIVLSSHKTFRYYLMKNLILNIFKLKQLTVYMYSILD